MTNVAAVVGEGAVEVDGAAILERCPRSSSEPPPPLSSTNVSLSPAGAPQYRRVRVTDGLGRDAARDSPSAAVIR